MTIKHIAMVLEAEGLDGPEKLLLIAYCNRTDDHGYCWPGQQRLADDCGTSPATVKRVKKRLLDMQLIASERRFDPKTGEPITNLTRVNLELLAAMKRTRTDYDDNVVEKITFAVDAPLPQKKQKAPKGSRPASDLLRDQDEPDPGLKLSPTPDQVEPDLPPNLSPTPAQVEPLTLSDPPENPQTPVRPSVGSTEASTGGEGTGGTDGNKSPSTVIQLTEGVRFLTALGEKIPRLTIIGKPLRDQGLVVDELFSRGWKDEVLWELLSRPLPTPLRKDVSAIIAKRLRDALDSPLPGPRRTWEDEATPTPQPYADGMDPTIHRQYECDGDHGMCGRPVESEGDRCRWHARQPQPAS